jgi:redox-sensitive bicupin YhaK (pirin superfamily)
VLHNQDADLWLAKLKPGECVTHPLAIGRYAWVHIAEGAVTVNGLPVHRGE